VQYYQNDDLTARISYLTDASNRPVCHRSGSKAAI
jgi:hypothetical protein